MKSRLMRRTAGQQFRVIYRVTGVYVATVDAMNREQAEDLALYSYYDPSRSTGALGQVDPVVVQTKAVGAGVYEVTVHVAAEYPVTVDAANAADARQQADRLVAAADWGDLVDVKTEYQRTL